MEKPFMLFASYRYYPDGGMGDYRGRYASIHECVTEATRIFEALSDDLHRDISVDVYDVTQDKIFALDWRNGAFSLTHIENGYDYNTVDAQMAMSKRCVEVE